MKSFWYKFLVCVLSLGMLYPTWVATGAQKAKADTGPVLLNQGFEVSKNGGSFSDIDKYDNKYVVATDNLHGSSYDIRFDANTQSSENLKDQAFELFLDISTTYYNYSQLETYYNSYYSGAVKDYLLDAAKGQEPFAYIKGDGTAAVSLLDGYMYSEHGLEQSMRIPGDYPVNSYKVNGAIVSGTNQYGLVSFTLQLDNSEPVVNVISPISGENVNGGATYDIEWNATDPESGIKDNSVKIRYYNGSIWNTLNQDLPNTGSYSWDVPTAHSSDYKVRVVVENNAGITGKSTSAKFNVDDYAGPIITLVGDQEISVLKGSVYNDSGATAIDNYDGDVTADIVTTSTVDTNVAGEYKVTYNVVDAAGNDAVEVERIVKVIDLSAVDGLSAVPGDGEVSLSWDAVAGAVSYNVYYKKTSEAGYIGPVNVPTSTTKITGLTNGVSYDFKVVAVNENGVEGEAAVVTATPKSSKVVLAAAPVVQEEVTQPETPAPESTVTTPTEEETPEVGEIKGEETTATDEEDINWTPWIILFVLIILAGAATGGYFYWFGNEEEEIVSEQVIEKSRKSNGKKSTAKKSSSKKSKRW